MPQPPAAFFRRWVVLLYLLDPQCLTDEKRERVIRLLRGLKQSVASRATVMGDEHIRTHCGVIFLFFRQQPGMLVWVSGAAVHGSIMEEG